MRRVYLFSLLLLTVLPVQLVSAQTQVSADAPTIEERLQKFEKKLEEFEKRLDAARANSNIDSVAHNDTASEDRFGALDQKLRILERERELDQENALVKAKEAPIVSAGADGFSITSADKSYRLKVGGIVQADGRTFYNDPTHSLAGGFLMRRARLRVDGTVGKYIDFRFLPDFGNGTVSIFDAYADLRFQSYGVLRGGKFKSPLGLEVLQEDADLTFIERSLVSDLLPNRDVGFQAWGTIGPGFLYQAAILNGAPDGTNIDLDTNKGRDVVGRVFATPFAKSGPKVLNGLGFGIGVSSGRENGAGSLSTFKSGGQNTFFSYVSMTTAATTAVANGARTRYSPQAYYYNGPFGLLAEYAEENQDVSFANGTSKHNLSTHAWQITGSWVITGEKKSYGRIVPKNRFGDSGIQRGPGFGAWEVAGRYGELNVDPLAFAAKLADPTKSAEAARAWAVGLNVYLNKNVKLGADYEQTHFEKGAGTAAAIANRPTENAFSQRLQVVF